MEIHEEFRIKINDTIRTWCYYPPLDAIVFEGNKAITIIEAATGCINKTFDFSTSNVRAPICIDVVGKQKLALACGNVFNCRSKFNDVFLCDSIFQTAMPYCSEKACIDLPMPEALMLLAALKTVSGKWENRRNLGFQCSLDTEEDETSDNVWKWNLVTFNCSPTIFYEWLSEINMELSENFPALPLISSAIYRIKCLQMSDYEIRLFIYDRFKELLNIEANRYLSFEMWPHKTYKWATPELMAKVGFYHHPRRINDDRALCFLCNICLITWEATDEPWSEHQRHSPSCPLFKQNYTSNVPLSVTEATTTAQKQNSSNNISLIAKSAGNRYVATVSEDGHICIWDTCYLFRKISEFDTPLLSKDGSITIDSACLIDNPLLIKYASNDADECFPGFHLVLGARFVPDYDLISKHLQHSAPDSTNSSKTKYIYRPQFGDQEASFLIVIDVAYKCSLISQDEKITLPPYYSTEDYCLNLDDEIPFDESNEIQYQDNLSIPYKQEPQTYEERVNVTLKDSFFTDLSLFQLWNENKSLTDVSVKSRDTGDTTVVHLIELLLDYTDDYINEGLTISSIHPIITENDDDQFESDLGSSVYLMVNIHKDADSDGASGGGALFIYRFLVDAIKDMTSKPRIKLQQMSSILLSGPEQVKNVFPISFESLESNCSESSSTANVDEIVQETMPVLKNTLTKSTFHWILLTGSNELYLYSLPLSQVSLDPIKQPLSEVATKINIKKELYGQISKLLLFSDMDRLCLLTDDGVMAFYSIVSSKKMDNSPKEIIEVREKISEVADADNDKTILDTPIVQIMPDPLIVDQEDVVDRLSLINDFIQYEVVTSRLKLTYGCNWVEVSPLEIIDFKTNVNNFINVSRCFTSKTGVQSEPPFMISGSPYMKVSDQQQCCTRTLNFRASQSCSREQIIEFSTAKQLCLGHVDLRFELNDKMNKNSNLIYVTLLRQQKFNGSYPSKDQTTGTIKVNTSQESNVIINDLEAPFIDDDISQYYDEVNTDVLRKLDGEVIAGPYLLNKYCHSDSTSVFLAMTSAELLKCRSRHYAILVRIRSRANSDIERRQSSSSLSSDRYSTYNSLNLNIKSISLTLRKFAKPSLSFRNERSQRLAILRNTKFFKQLLDLLVEESNSKMPRPQMVQNAFDIFNWIVVMYLNDIKPHSDKIHKIMLLVTDYVYKLILIHLVQGDRYASKMMSKILNGLIKLESRYWRVDNRPSICHEYSYFMLSKTVHSVLQSNIDWLLLAENSVAVHNYLLILDNLDQLFVVQQCSSSDNYTPNSSLVSKLKLLSLISQRYSETMDTEEHVYLKTILGYPHNPLGGDLFDVVNDAQLTEPVNTLYSNLAEMYSKKPVITLDSASNDSISKYLMHTFHDHSLKHIQEQLNEQISSIEEKVSNDFTIQDLQKVYHKMVMTNVSSNIQLMSPDETSVSAPSTIKTPDQSALIPPTISNMTWPGFDPFLLSKMNPKQMIYSDLKKKLKSGHSSTINELNVTTKSSHSTLEHVHYTINASRKISILESDVLPVFFESGSEGTFLETSDYSDQAAKEPLNCSDYSPSVSIPLMHMMDDHSGLPATPKTTPAITTQTTPMQNSPVQSPSSSAPVGKSEILETSSLLLENVNQQRLKFSQHTSSLLTNPCSYHIVVNRLHANARRHVILDLHQWSVITDIIVPTCDKLQKIIVRVGRNRNEEDMQTVVIHSKIATEPLLLLNIQPKIICQFVQIIVIAKSNITAMRNRINIGHLYGRDAILPWEMSHDLTLLPSKSWCDPLSQMLDQLWPQAETVSVRYAISSDTLKHLLHKCIKTGINRRILSQSMSDYHSKSKMLPSTPKCNAVIVQLITQVNSAYNKCCQLQQHFSIINKQIKQLQIWISMSDPEYRGRSPVANFQRIITVTSVDKLRVLMEFLLESLLLDKVPCFDISDLEENMTLLSKIMTHAMWFGNREMQIIIVAWIPKFLTKSSDISQAIKIWCHDWLKEFLLSTFTNRNTALTHMNKEEIFSYICVIFQRLSNAGYHLQLLHNLLDILIIMLQPHVKAENSGICSIDIELLNWMMLFIDFVLSWMNNDSSDMEEPFSEWKFLFWNKTYHHVDDRTKVSTIDGTKDRMNYLKQTLLQLNCQKEEFVDYVKKSQYDPWFSQLIINEYFGHFVKLSLKINTTISKMKKSLSVTKSKKPPVLTKRDVCSTDIDPLLSAASASIAVTIKFMLNTLKCMDFQVSQDTFILTCMVLNKLFVLAHDSGFHLNDFIDKESIYSLIQRAFRKSKNSAMGLDVYSLHACKLLLSEIVFSDIRTLVKSNTGERSEDVATESTEKTSLNDNNQADNALDCESVDNDDDDDPDNEEEDVTPTGADDEDLGGHPDEPYMFYITHLGNLDKQKDGVKINEESPSDEYVDIVEEFDFLGQPTSFIPTYQKAKFPKDYQSAFKPIDLDKQISINSIESMRSEKNELNSSQSVLYYDLRLENTIFSHQEIMFNHSFLNWMHQIRTQLYSQITPCPATSKSAVPGNCKAPKPLAIAFVLESVDQLLDNESDGLVDFEELILFMSNICHHLEKESLLGTFDSVELCSVSLQTLLDKILQRCSVTFTSLSLYCQLICYLLHFKDYVFTQRLFRRIFDLTDSLQCQELNDSVVNNFRVIVVKSLDNFSNNAEFFLEILYGIVEKCHWSSKDLRASEQLASVIMDSCKYNLVDHIQRSGPSYANFMIKINTLTQLYVDHADSTEQRKCFTSLVPKSFTDQLLQIERSLVSTSGVASLSPMSTLLQLNLITYDMIATNPGHFLSFADKALLTKSFETLSRCTSNILENSKLSDVTTVSEDLVRHSQTITVGDVVWRTLVKIAHTIMSTSHPLANDLVTSMLTVVQQSLPSINEPLFLLSLWLLKNLPSSDDIDYSALLTSTISVILSSCESRLSNSPLNTVTTRLAIAKMQRYHLPVPDSDECSPTADSGHISNSSRLNVAPYCQIFCGGNDSSDQIQLARLLLNAANKSPLTTLRSNRLKPADTYWSYDFLPHETNVTVTIILPCEMIVHKLVLHPRSSREFSATFELTTLRHSRDRSTITFQQRLKPVSSNDGILVDNICGNQLSNRIQLKFDRPVSSKLVVNKLEIFTINQWWDHRFQATNDASNLCLFRTLHLFHYIIGIRSPSARHFVTLTLPRYTNFFSILLNWNHVNSSSSFSSSSSSSSSSSDVEVRLLNRSISNLIMHMFIQLGQRQHLYSELFIHEILRKVSIGQALPSHDNVHFTNEISIMELNIFYYILTLDDDFSVARLRLVLRWLVDNVLTGGLTERSRLVYHDSVASVVYLLAVVLWHHADHCASLWHDIDPSFVDHLQLTILLANGHLRKALYRLLCSACAAQPALFRELVANYPVINVDDDCINRANLKSMLWASLSKTGCQSIRQSGLLLVLVKRINVLLTTNSATVDPYKFYDYLSSILTFLGKLCRSGCRSIKLWLGTSDVSSFWSLLLDHLIHDGHYMQPMSSMLKMKLIGAAVQFFREVTLCCEDNQTTFIKIFIDALEKYRLRSDTIILSNCLRQIILDVIVKEPLYGVLVDMPEPNSLFKLFPGWLVSSDELGRCRLSFRHPGIGYKTNCILIDRLPMTSTVSSVLLTLSHEISSKRKASKDSDTSRSNQDLSPMKPRPATSANDMSTSLVYNSESPCANSDPEIFDLVTLHESADDFNCGHVRLSCSVHLHDQQDDQAPSSANRPVNPAHLLLKFTEQGGLKLLSMMMPLLYTDIRRVSAIGGSSYRPTTTAASVSNSMGFIDDELVVASDLNKVVKSLPLMPAHSITALCLFLHIELYPLYLIRDSLHRSALIHLLLGITDDDCGLSLIQTFPQLQCLPFTILSDLLQDASLSTESRALIVDQCIELGLVDFFISLLSILGHVDSGLSMNSFRSSGPWANFIAQSLCDLHYQLFSPLTSVDKLDSTKAPNTTSTSSSSGKPAANVISSSMDPKSQYITFMPFIDEKKNYWAKGTGFGTGGMYSTWDSEYVQMRQRLEETNASAILDTLSAFIGASDDDVPNLRALLDENENVLPQKSVESIYQSTLLSFICCYLRNDSVLDVSQHVNIYKSVLRLIRATAKHRCLHYLLFPHLNPVGTNPDLVHSLNQSSSMSSVNVSQLLFQLKICVETYINRLKKAPGASNKSTENTRRLTRQFSIRRKNTNYSSVLQRINDALKTSKDDVAESKEDKKAAESENLTLLMPEINGTLKLLEDVELDIVERNKIYDAENLKLSDAYGLQNGIVYCFDENGVDHNSFGKSSRDTESKYMELMKKLQFGMFEMISPMSDENGKVKFAVPYHFKKNVENAVTSQSSSASLSRARRLAQETVTLSTSLPLSYSSSVFVRCDENHLDIMKVIIIGPPDTPYANGCFEFDVYFPPDYPKTPPLLNLQTTGNGSVRFNPNLYNEGKVCLSILNTWHGRPEERWSSRTSSFLQVLVSIQSLILVSEPYFNEPGYERSRGTASGNNASKAYSANIQAATSRWAIFEMMKNPPLCFAEVIKKHFLLKKDDIIDQVQAWIDMYVDPTFDPALLNNTRPSIANSLQNLKKNLSMIKKEFETLEKEELSL